MSLSSTSSFEVGSIIPSWKSSVQTFLAYNYYTFGHFPDLNDIALEGLIHKAMKTQRSDADWVKGAHLPWDLSLTNSETQQPYRIQVKGTLVSGKTMHLSSFRLGVHSGSVDSLKEGILKLIRSNDVWYVVAREMEDQRSMRVSFFECNQNSFLYDESMYNFKEVITGKRIFYQNKTTSKVVFTKVIPSTSHQLWYMVNYEQFKTSMQGVRLVDSSVFRVEDFPTTITLLN